MGSDGEMATRRKSGLRLDQRAKESHSCNASSSSPSYSLVGMKLKPSTVLNAMTQTIRAVARFQARAWAMTSAYGILEFLFSGLNRSLSTGALRCDARPRQPRMDRRTVCWPLVHARGAPKVGLRRQGATCAAPRLSGHLARALAVALGAGSSAAARSAFDPRTETSSCPSCPP